MGGAVQSIEFCGGRTRVRWSTGADLQVLMPDAQVTLCFRQVSRKILSTVLSTIMSAFLAAAWVGPGNSESPCPHVSIWWTCVWRVL